MNSLSRHVLWTTQASLKPWWEEKPPSLFKSFCSLTLVYFLSVSSCAKLRLPKTTSPRLCKTSQRPLQRLLNSKPISTSEKPFSAKDDKRESFKHKSNASKTPRSLLCWCHFNIDFSLIEKSMRVLNMWLMVVQVYAIAHIAVNVGYQILILLI